MMASVRSEPEIGAAGGRHLSLAAARRGQLIARTILTTGFLAGAPPRRRRPRGPRRASPPHYLPTLRAPAASPVAIHGGDPHAFLHTGERLHRGQSLMRVRVDGPQHSGIQLRFTCPSGAVTGYGYKGADALAVNGRPILSQHPSARRSRPRPTSTTTVASPAIHVREGR